MGTHKDFHVSRVLHYHRKKVREAEVLLQAVIDHDDIRRRQCPYVPALTNRLRKQIKHHLEGK